MGKTLYLECNTGISGDMTVAALLDAGADMEILKDALESLPVQGFTVEISRVKKAGLDVCDFLVKLDAAHENHDHDMAYLHGHEHHHHEKEEVHSHEHHHHEKEEVHSHGHHHHEKEVAYSHEHPHDHRGLPEILDIIDKTKITARAKDTAAGIFRILAEAEAKAHGVSLEQVHFHEVGAVDSIVDIIAAAVCLDNLDITEVIVPFVCEGTGTVRCQHGILPVPVPAVVNIIYSRVYYGSLPASGENYRSKGRTGNTYGGGNCGGCHDLVQAPGTVSGSESWDRRGKTQL